MMQTMQQEIDERTNLTSSNKLELLLFRLGNDPLLGRTELFGINVFKVREIIPMPTVTAVAGSPPHMMGVVDLRGQILPVIDLSGVCCCSAWATIRYSAAPSSSASTCSRCAKSSPCPPSPPSPARPRT